MVGDKMVYLLYGNIKYLINKEINKLKKSDLDISNYILNDGINNILEDANSLSMFGNKKLIIVNDSFVFTSINKQEIEEKKLLDYINNPNENTILVFTVNYEKLDERKKIVKEFKKKCVIKEFNEVKDSDIYDIFNDYKISRNLINLIKDRIGNNLDLIQIEKEKLEIFNDNPDEITKDDIISLTNKNIDDNIFSLIESIVSKDKDKSMEIYDDMIINGEEPIKIIVMLANQFRIIYQCKELIKRNLNNNEIASILNIHPYRVKLALEKGIRYKNDILLKYLYDLANIDINVKSGKVDKFLALELFILSI